MTFQWESNGHDGVLMAVQWESNDASWESNDAYSSLMKIQWKSNDACSDPMATTGVPMTLPMEIYCLFFY
jgi:hypothetical protein